MRYLALLLLVLINCIGVNAQANWTNLDTGINDNLTGVVFLNLNGMASGEQGLYYTTTGGQGPLSWTRLQIADPTLSAIYENTKFTHCYSSHSNTTDTGYVYACGQDLATTKAVILKIAIPSMVVTLKYSGAVNTQLNKIEWGSNVGRYVAVGNNGLMISFSDSAKTTINSGTTDDLTTVDFDVNSYFYFGSYGKVKRATLNNTTLTNVYELDIPNTPVKDINLQYSVGGDYLLSNNVFSTTPSSQRKTIYNGPLNMNCLWVETGGFILVGTDQGIYRTVESSYNFLTNALELQPETTNYHIKEFWKQDLNTNKYACGDNGVILRTSIYGGYPKPYVRITTTDGGCYPGSVTFHALWGTAVSGKWYVNGTVVQNTLGNFYYTFTAVGTYTISLVVKNNDGVESTDTISFSVVTPPDITKTVTLSKNLLCKQETVQVQVANSEPNVIYSLQQGFSGGSYGISQPSTGGNLTFNATIDLTGDYYIYAQNSLANCGRRFNNPFHIVVEETKADFHSSLINAEVNEPVDFYQNAVDSQNFEWHFNPNATVSTSGLPDVQSSFTLPGQATTSLHSWSNNGCHDTVTENIPFVYETPAVQDDCFLLTNNSTDPNWPGYYNPDISQMVPISSGFLTCGTFFNEIFDSNYGITLNLNGKKGGYLAKHNRNGVLKWVVYNVNTTSINTNDNVIYSCAEDSNGDIYISGKGSGKFYDNAGHVTDLAQTPIGITNRYYLIKLNSKGELIWYMQNYVFGFVKLAIDHQNNITALSEFVTNYVSPQLYFNGVAGQLIGQQTTPMDEEATNEIIKISPQGTVIWDTKVRLESANIREFYDLGFDSTNNIYISMGYDIYARIYRPGNNSSQIIYGDGAYGGKIGIVKLNTNGQIVWLTQSGTVNTESNPNDGNRLYAMIVEDNGTIYFTGSNATGLNWNAPLNYTYVFYNTNSTVTTTNQGPYFVAKVNAAGICQWIRGAGHTYYGSGQQIAKAGNEIFAVGQISNNSGNSCSGNFDSTNGNNYNLTINKFDYFVSVYDESGNLKRLFVNNEDTNVNNFDGFTGFFKGTDDYFYLAKNLGYTLSSQVYHDFGMTTPTLNGVDGTIVRFTESCGILKYDATLGNNDFSNSLFDNLSVVPNPTTGEFSIKLHNTFNNIVMIVTDITGKVVSEEKFNNVTEISSNITGETGLYFVRLKSSQGEKCFKLIKL